MFQIGDWRTVIAYPQLLSDLLGKAFPSLAKEGNRKPLPHMVAA